MDNGYLSIYLSITTFKHYISGMTPWFGCCTAACSMTAGCVTGPLLQHCTALQSCSGQPLTQLNICILDQDLKWKLSPKCTTL